MKFLQLIVLLLLGLDCFANKIDSLQNMEDVYNFLVKRVDKRFKKLFPLARDPNVADTARYGRNKFFKVDIDNNGLTDLVVYGNTNLLVILDTGKDKYSVRNLDRGSFALDAVTLIAIDTSSLPRKLIVHQSEKPPQQVDTLVFKFNAFIEYNRYPMTSLDLDSITLKTDLCFGECPVFEMTIYKDRNAIYKAIKYNDKNGEFYGTIPKDEFEELLSILKSLQPDKLNDNYSVNWTDEQTATIGIHYDHKTKFITDYGEIGTFGLSLLYSKFFIWRSTIEWGQ